MVFEDPGANLIRVKSIKIYDAQGELMAEMN